MESNTKKQIVIEEKKQQTSEVSQIVNPGSICQLQGKRVGDSLLGNLMIHERLIRVPSFIFEVANEEDFMVMILNNRLLKESHIVSVPAFKWDSYTHHIPVAIDDNLNRLSTEFIMNNHMMVYEPPELYRYAMPRRMVIHALRDDRIRIKKFYKLGFWEDNKEGALALLPPFEREFVMRQWDSLMWKKYWHQKKLSIKNKDDSALRRIKRVYEKPKNRSDVEGGWTNTEDQYKRHIASGMQKTIEMNISSSFVPVVRTLKSSSEKYVRDQVIRQNQFAERYWRNVLKGSYLKRGRPWLHLSLDKSIFMRDNDEHEQATTPVDLIDVINVAFNPIAHCGICLTMTGHKMTAWENAWSEGKPRARLEDFIKMVSDIAAASNLPVYAARSKWVGMGLLDLGLAFAGTIMNGNERITEAGGSADGINAFGKTPNYGECGEKLITQLFSKGQEVGELADPIDLHHFDGIEDKCDPLYQEDPTLFRMEFGKPRRLVTHSTEVREIRGGLERGTLRPGLEYIGRSKVMDRCKGKEKESSDDESEEESEEDMR